MCFCGANNTPCLYCMAMAGSPAKAAPVPNGYISEVHHLTVVSKISESNHKLRKDADELREANQHLLDEHRKLRKTTEMLTRENNAQKAATESAWSEYRKLRDENDTFRRKLASSEATFRKAAGSGNVWQAALLVAEVERDHAREDVKLLKAALHGIVNIAKVAEKL